MNCSQRLDQRDLDRAVGILGDVFRDRGAAGTAADDHHLRLGLRQRRHREAAGGGERTHLGQELPAIGRHHVFSSLFSLVAHCSSIRRPQASEIGGKRGDFLFRQPTRDRLHDRIGALLRPVFVHDLDEDCVRASRRSGECLRIARDLMAGDAFGRQILSERLVPCATRATPAVAASDAASTTGEQGSIAARIRMGRYSTFGPLPVSGVTSSARARPVILASPGCNSSCTASSARTPFPRLRGRRR